MARRSLLLISCLFAAPISAFIGGGTSGQVQKYPQNERTVLASRRQLLSSSRSSSILFAKDDISDDQIRPKIGVAPLETKASTIEEIAAETNKQNEEELVDETSAATNTVNARLQAELAAAAEAEKSGKSRLSNKVKAAFRSEKTDEERQRAIEEARNLNGVNPLVAGGSGLLAFAGSYGLWTATSFLATFFADNPVETDFYTAARLSGVFRNVIIGLFSLASGFFGVIGLGLVLLGGRVAIGVLTGELDPTPIRKKKGEEVVMPNVMDLMLNKKPGRRGGRKKGRSDDNQFGV